MERSAWRRLVKFNFYYRQSLYVVGKAGLVILVRLQYWICWTKIGVNILAYQIIYKAYVAYYILLSYLVMNLIISTPL